MLPSVVLPELGSGVGEKGAEKRRLVGRGRQGTQQSLTEVPTGQREEWGTGSKEKENTLPQRRGSPPSCRSVGWMSGFVLGSWKGITGRGTVWAEVQGNGLHTGLR